MKRHGVMSSVLVINGRIGSFILRASGKENVYIPITTSIS
jgi:hypothetical protein